MSHMLIKDDNGELYVIKKTDIRRIYRRLGDKKTSICFTGTKNTPITVTETVEDFFNIHMAK